MERVDYIVHGEYIVTADSALTVLRNGAVAVKDGIILDTGPYNEISKNYYSANVIGNSYSLVMPGLINTHTHAPMVYFRGLADDLPLKEWLENHIWPAEAKWLSREFVSDATELACLEMLKAGVICFNDMYFFSDATAEAAKRMGMRAVIGLGILDFPTPGGKGPDDYLKRAEDFILKWKDDEYIRPAVAPHAIYTCSKETLIRSKILAARYKVPLHIHLSETEWEVKESLKNFNKRPVEYLNSIEFLDSSVIAAHAVWLDEREIDLMAESGASVSHCIESNLKLASGIAPLPLMIKKGVKVTSGTDGAASNNDLDVLSEISLAAKLHKAIASDPTVLDARTALLMATRWAAEATGLGGLTGSIEKGKKADLIICNLDKPHLTPVYDIYSHIVYTMKSSDVETVMIDGKIVINQRELKTGDEREILRKARIWQERIKGS
ncbi:MAG: amidohydrolase family protein [Thermodesulfovibrionales bacterium]|nr:amidohydrolase family protein [Thermodesulfovibrionales bacterium]